ncbi:MAG: pseudouridine-5-phosphate glycosidase [Nitriliruptorales bacterium]|nr:pseudouridine-5-phosphate glycosidase [Nitriliruptorales bacterium]
MSAVPAAIHVRPDVAAALEGRHPVVALESTLFAHGLPRHDGLELAHRIEAIVADEGALAATVGVVAGRPTVGLDDEELELIVSGSDIPKLGIRDLPSCVAAGRHGATTVASTAHLAAQAGISVFATGGLGGVHREARDTWDESADLQALATTPVIVVCAGVKSILDVNATLQRLETLGVPVVGYRTTNFPGFYVSTSGHDLVWSVHDPAMAARTFWMQRALGLADRAMVLAAPLPEAEQLDPTLHDRVLHRALEQMRSRGITGPGVTPFLLDYFHSNTGGQSLRVNVRIIERNARLAAQVAAASVT